VPALNSVGGSKILLAQREHYGLALNAEFQPPMNADGKRIE
jgi:hypothetical protein